MPLPFGLSPLEAKILDDRLHLSDCIAQVLSPPEDDPLDGFAPEDTEAVCDRLLHRDWLGALAINQQLAHAVLEDAVAGNTFGPRHHDASPQKRSAIAKAGHSLAEKVSEVVGHRVTFSMD